ncbi:MAG: hypothetical protein OHK0012_22410 [Synechococcales cyanobacterium]
MAESQSHPTPYSDADVQRLLAKAWHYQQQDLDQRQQSFSAAQLYDMAEELGISSSALATALREDTQEQAQRAQHQSFQRFRRQRLTQHWTTLATVGGVLSGLDLLTSHHWSWSAYIVGLWGMRLAVLTWKQRQTSGDDYERAFQRWQSAQEWQRLGSHMHRSLRQWLAQQFPNA